MSCGLTTDRKKGLTGVHSCLLLPSIATRNRIVSAEKPDSFTEVATTQLDLDRAREERGGDTFAYETLLTTVKARLRLRCHRQMCKHGYAACAPPHAVSQHGNRLVTRTTWEHLGIFAWSLLAAAPRTKLWSS